MTQSNTPDNSTSTPLFATKDTNTDAAAGKKVKTMPPSSTNQAQADAVSDANREELGHLELLEERAVVDKERLDVGKVTVTKQQRTKTIEVPVELVEEVLTIETTYQDADSEGLLSGNYDDKDILRHVEPTLDSVAVVNINGNRIEVGNDPVEIVLSRQVATITKETFAVQQIDVEKSVHTHTDNIAVELKYEELDVKEEGFLDHKDS